MPQSEIKKIVRSYAKHLKKNEFPFSEIFLYGSYAKGKAHGWSDIDVCIISKKFKGKNWDKYEKKLWYLRREIDPRISPIGLSQEEFDTISPLAYEIKKTGIKIL